MDKNEKETHVILARSHVMDEFAKNNHYVYVSDYKMFLIIQKVGDNRTRGILISFWCSFRPSHEYFVSCIPPLKSFLNDK